MTSVLSKKSFLWTTVSLVLTRLSYCSVPVPVPVPDIAKYFGTKSRYEEVNPHLLQDLLSVNRSVLKAPLTDGCTPTHLTAVIRHGSRYPTAKNIRRIRKLHELVLKEASNREMTRGWEMWYTDDMDGQLVEKGRQDLLYLAKRLSMLFPSLLSEENLNQEKIWFQSSSKQRCIDSMEAFQQGLYEHWGLEEVRYRQEVNDDLMRFFERCRGYVEGVETNRTALVEVEKFKGGKEMEGVRRRMAERLGLPLHRITPDMAEAAFFLCSYEFSIRSVSSPWCFLFDDADAKVLEYKTDLKQYWKRSHGHVISSRSSCPLFHHIFSRLDQAAHLSRSSEAASILVGHAETLLPLLSLLGLYKDQEAPPTAHNYNTQHGRTFRTGRIVPYAANLLFVLYDCRQGPRLQLLLNESPVRFPGLEEDAPLYQDVRARYRDLLEGCDFHKECEVKSSRRPNTEL